MSSKLVKADAQEWLESLQQVGEGWWRQVALAVKAGAPKALGMDRREFARTIGQRMIDPREAIIELYRDKTTIEAIADILGISRERVRNTLIEEGLVKGEIGPTGGHGRKAAAAEASDASEAAAADESEDLQAQIDALAAEVKGEKAKAKREKKELRDELTKLQEMLLDAEREARKKAEEELTEAERERARKEAEAWAEEQGRKVMVGFSHLIVESIVGGLEEAAGEVRLLIEQDAWTDEAVRQVETARAGFDEEFNVARMSAATN